MARFLTPDELRAEVKSIFSNAERILFIVSPYIKLDAYLKRLLERKITDPDFEILLIFGKNDHDIGKSLNSDDLHFFKQFKNIEIFYHPNLHAKYYANDSKSVITSLNLHTFSYRNNIESGVLFERRVMGRDNSEDNRSFEFFLDLTRDCESIYEKRTVLKRSFFGLFKSEKPSEIMVDNTMEIHQPSQSKTNSKMGFCIRTGKRIPFNMKHPFSKNAFEGWAIYKNENYREKYCHFSGEASHGETSMKYPVLRKYYRKAVESGNY